MGKRARRLGVAAALLVMAMLASSTPVRTEARDASPVAGSTTTPLLDLRLGADQVPHEGIVSLSRNTWTPGATGSVSVSGWPPILFSDVDTVAGVRFDYVLAGTLAVRVTDGPLLVQRAAIGGVAPAPEAITSGGEIELRAGDTAVYAFNATWDGRNTGASESEILAGGIGSRLLGLVEITEAYDGVRTERLGRFEFEDWQHVPVGPLAVTLRRTTLESGVALPPYPVSPAAPELLVVESGVMEIQDFLPDGGDLGTVPIPRGEMVPPAYPDQATRAIRAATDSAEPLVFLSLTFSEEQEAAATAPGTATAVPSETVVSAATPTAPVAVGDVAHAGALDIAVTDVERTADAIAETPPVGQYVVVHATLTAVGTTPVVWNLDWFAVTDEDGQIYPVAVWPSDWLVLQDTTGTLNRAFSALQAGVPASIVLVFDVPPGASGLTLGTSDFAAYALADGAPSSFAISMDADQPRNAFGRSGAAAAA